MRGQTDKDVECPYSTTKDTREHEGDLLVLTPLCDFVSFVGYMRFPLAFSG